MLNKEISDKIKKLNYIYPFYQEWNQYKAIKKHVDYFGDTILVGQEYFRFKLSGYRGDDIKLSFCSMEKFLNILFITCPELESKSEKAYEKSFEDVRNIIDDIRK